MFKSDTVEPRFNKPLYNEVLGITNYILQPSNSKMYGKVPLYNEVLGITNQFLQSLGTSLNQGSTVVIRLQIAIEVATSFSTNHVEVRNYSTVAHCCNGET